MRTLLLATALSLSAHLATAAGVEIPEVPLPDVSFPSWASDTPEVSFDLPPSLLGRDVTTDAFRAERPGERLVEVVAPVSLLLYHGDADRVRDVVVEIDGGAAGLVVHDYAPRTELASELAEPIEVKRTDSTDRTLGGSLGAKVAADVALTPTVSGGVSRSKSRTVTRSELPPKEAVVVSGTTGGRSGVYFKLRRSSQTTLEGEQTFRVTFVAPADWDGGPIEVRCLARGRKKWLFAEQRRVWSETARPVELRLVSHTTAKPVAEPPPTSPDGAVAGR